MMMEVMVWVERFSRKLRQSPSWFATSITERVPHWCWRLSRPRPGSSGLETKTETLVIRSRNRDRDLDKMNSSLETMVSRSHHWLHQFQFQLVTEHLLKGATDYGNRATGIGTKHAVLRPRPRPGSSGLETKTETLATRSRDRDRNLDKMNSSAFGHMVSRSQHCC